jgi:hypothetical protein
VRDVPDTGLTPYLVIKVNGVKIAARGGNWGTDDWRKRVERERLEPYFRLHKDAHLNIIRNWVGQNTEDVFYDLADEYGLLVLNDFWASTQDYQLEPQDVPLFLANAADVIGRYRNHPSIALWFGRNEGVPQPILNEGLEALVHDLDGTRWYTGSSNRVNLQNSGPYNYREPETYFTEHAKGFSVEVGTPSFPTLEAFEAAVPGARPLADQRRLGLSRLAPDRERRDQDLPGRHDRQAGRADQPRGLRAQGPADELRDAPGDLRGHEPGAVDQVVGPPAVDDPARLALDHVADPQPRLRHPRRVLRDPEGLGDRPRPDEPADHRLALVNNGLTPIVGATLRARVWAWTARSWPTGPRGSTRPPTAPRWARRWTCPARWPGRGGGAAGPDRRRRRAAVEQPLLGGRDAEGERKLSAMAAQPVSIAAAFGRAGAETVVTVTLANTGSAPALNGKLTLVDAKGARILPAYYADNYVSLLPGERRTVEIRYPGEARGGAKVELRGWNVTPANGGGALMLDRRALLAAGLGRGPWGLALAQTPADPGPGPAEPAEELRLHRLAVPAALRQAENAVDRDLPAERRRVVFMGDSITQGWFDKHPAFFADNGLLGRGIGGQVTAQMLVRFWPDVVALKPAAVHILAGVNDIAQNAGPYDPAATQANLQAMTTLAQANGIKVILATVTPVGELSLEAGPGPHGQGPALNAWLPPTRRARRGAGRLHPRCWTTGRAG